ncbi:hypothetical protein HGO38_04725 [Rhizobium sp. CG5]|uniref:glycosyltransferase family 39 protein n=1 Tax=Rhizobium sp. CG5 TaxID=2726076 RepID=UPI002033A4D4|nr:glycosyltransferase family 39 protein [Rhizobium sp. CG5]MCM2472780.1 hypothetical protein [Rhizobium sp. CG5]
MPIEMSKTKSLLILMAILAVGAVLRLYAIDSQALWSDEGQTLTLSLWPIMDMISKPTDPTPFLYYALHQVFLSPDSSVAAVRSLSVVFGMAQLVLMFGLGRLCFGRAGGLLAAALMAVWSSHVDYSMEARAYALLGFLILLAFYGLILYVKRIREAASLSLRLLALALFAIGNVLSFYTHVIAAFSIAFTGALLFGFALSRPRRYWPEVAITFAVMAILAVPGVLRILAQVETGHEFNWLVQASPMTFISTVADMFFPIGFWDNPLTNSLDIRLDAKFVAIPVFALLLAVSLWFSRFTLARVAREQPILALLVLGCAVLPAAIWLVGYVGRPIFLGRVLLFCIPGLILLLVAMIVSQPRQRAIALSMATIGLWLASTLLFGMMREKQDWRGANGFLAAAVAPDDIIAMCPDFEYPALRHAASASVPVGRAVLLGDEKGALTLIEAGLGASRTWAADYFVASQRYDVRPTVTLDIQPGQSIWRVDGICWDGIVEYATLDRILAPIDPAPSAEWSQKAKYDDHILIRRYRVTQPASLTLRQGLGAGQQ